MSVERGLVTTMLVGNLGGAVLTFVYFRFFDPAAMDGVTPLGPIEVAYFVIAFALLYGAGNRFARAWMRPILGAQGALPAGPAGLRLQRRALMMPVYFALLSFSGWVAAALIWGVLWPLLAGNFRATAALRQGFGIVFVCGTMVATYIFLAIERIWRERLPLLFPDGDLAAAGAPRLAVRRRLVLESVIVSILPMVVLSVAARSRAQALLGADAEAAEAIIQNLIMVEGILAIVGGIAAIRLARFVAESVSAPLKELEAAMAQVAEGRLDARCAVVSNDEIGAVAEGFNRMVAGLREREVIRETFGRYVSPEVRDEILAGRASLAGDLREVTILFADLRDFTPWVEASPAGEVVAGLNEYFTEMDAAIRAQGGLVLQFIGDEIEAVFGAPGADAQHAAYALAAARDMQLRLDAWNTRRRAQGKAELQHGIGIHTGTVLAGNIGSSERMSYALVGDAVNVASRIQSLNKEFGTRLLVSGATRAQLVDVSGLTTLPSVRVKGRQAEVEVYSVD